MARKHRLVLTIVSMAVSILVAAANGVAQCTEEKLVASDAAEDAEFGRSVTIHGDVVVVGAPCDDEFGEDTGAAYVFRFSAVEGKWLEEAKLVPKDVSPKDGFGTVLLAENKLFVGAEGDQDNGLDSGSVYFFRFDAELELWVEEQKLLPSDGAPEQRFGRGKATDGGVLVVGARTDNENGNDAGAAYVFIWDGRRWIEKQKLLTEDLSSGDTLGWGVSIDGANIVLGAPDNENFGDDTGAAYVFRHDDVADEWRQVQKLIVSDARHNTLAGEAVAICGDWLAVGGPGDDENGFGSGAVYMFKFDPKTNLWEEKQKIMPWDGEENDHFGEDLSMSGATLAVGRYGDNNENGSAGAAHVYSLVNGKWLETIKVIAADGEVGDLFGRAVCTDGKEVIAGAYHDDDAGPRSGAAYVFDIPQLGDIDADCEVDAHDIIVLLGAWGPCPHPQNCSNCPPDLDGDCDVDAADLIILLGNWG